MAAGGLLTPVVAWAQRKDVLLLTVKIPGLTDPDIKVEAEQLVLSSGSRNGQRYELRIPFLHKVEPSGHRQVVRENTIELVLPKAEQGAPFWGRLVADKEKQHWLRVDFNKWVDEEDTESEEEPAEPEAGDPAMEELEGRLAGLGRQQQQQMPGLPGPADWAAGLAPRQQQEWLVDCYRMRVDDHYALGGDVKCGTLYDPDRSSASVVQDFLVFCRLAARRGALPAGWSWPGLLETAATLLPYAFEKSDAQEKYGGENVFSVVMGGRSLRHMGEVIYGSGIRGMDEDELVQELEEELAGRRRTAAMVAGVGGAAAWDKLQAEVARELGRMYGSSGEDEYDYYDDEDEDSEDSEDSEDEEKDTDESDEVGVPTWVLELME